MRKYFIFLLLVSFSCFGQTLYKTININLCDDSVSYSGGTGWNDFQRNLAGTSHDLYDDNDVYTGYTFYVEDEFDGTENHAGESSGPYPTNVNLTYWQFQNTSTINVEFRNLLDTCYYDITFYGSRNNALINPETVRVQIGSNMDTYNDAENTLDTAFFNNISPSTGTIRVTINQTSGSYYGHVNAIVIREYSTTLSRKGNIFPFLNGNEQYVILNVAQVGFYRISTPTPTSQSSIVALLGKGFDVGSLTSTDDTVNYLNLTQADFDSIAAKGFNHVRLCFSAYNTSNFGDSGSPDYTIENDVLLNIDSAIDYCINAGLVAMFDYHGAIWIDDPTEANKNKYLLHWQQIAERYQSYPDSQLVFELMNEPKYNYSGTNQIYQQLVDTIRLTNPTRWLVIDAPAYSDVPGLDSLAWPTGDSLMLSMHLYDPRYFNFQWPSGDYSSYFPHQWYPVQPLKDVLETYWEPINTYATANNCPVIIGEWGTMDSINFVYKQSRIDFMSYASRYFESQGWAWGLWTYDWDFKIWNTSGVYDTDIVDAIITDPEPTRSYDSTTLYQSDFSSSYPGWSITAGAAILSISGNELVVTPTSYGSDPDGLVLKYTLGSSFAKDSVYRVSYSIRSSSDRYMYINFPGYPRNSITLGTDQYVKVVSYVYPITTATGYALFRIGGNSAAFYVTNLKIEKIGLL